MTHDGILDYGVASQTLPGETRSGDRYIVTPRPDGILVGVVDGLGHGAEAAAAADRAVETIEHHAAETLITLAQRCHVALSGTRGVVMSLARFHPRDETLVWLGVGNVEGVLLRSHNHDHPIREPLLVRGGVIGDRLPPLMASLVPVAKGDLLVLATDGINSNFERAIVRTDPPQVIADKILAAHAKGNDDALVVVSRYLGTRGNQ
jgi:serine/threonine protein phosphatase PrpC